MNEEQLASAVEQHNDSEKRYNEQRLAFMKKLRDALAGQSIKCNFLGLGEGWDDKNLEHKQIWEGQKADNRPLTEKLVSFSSDGCYDNEIISRFVDFSGQNQENKLTVFQAAKIPEINDLAMQLLDSTDMDAKIKTRIREEMPKVERFR